MLSSQGRVHKNSAEQSNSRKGRVAQLVFTFINCKSKRVGAQENLREIDRDNLGDNSVNEL